MADFTTPVYSNSSSANASALAGYSFDWGLTNGHDFVTAKGAQVTIVTSPTPPRSNQWLQFDLTGASPAGVIDIASQDTPTVSTVSNSGADQAGHAPNGGVWGLVESYDLRIGDLPSGGNFQLGSRDSSNNPLAAINTSGQIIAGADEIASGRALAVDTDYHVQTFIVAPIPNEKTDRWAVVVRVNGDVWCIGSTASSWPQNSRFGSNTQLSCQVWLGNFVRGWMDVTRPIPKFRVVRLNPTGEGTYETGVTGYPDTTDKFNNWDENDPDNGNGSSSGSTNTMTLPTMGNHNRCSSTLADLPTGDDPWLVTPRIVYQEATGTGSKALDAWFIERYSGVDRESQGIANVADTNYHDHSGWSVTDPSSTAWTETSVNGLELGVKQSNSSGSATTIRVTTLFADVVVDSASDSDYPPVLPLWGANESWVLEAAAAAPATRRIFIS